MCGQQSEGSYCPTLFRIGELQLEPCVQLWAAEPKQTWRNQSDPVESYVGGQEPTAHILQGQVEGVKVAESGKEDVKG